MRFLWVWNPRDIKSLWSLFATVLADFLEWDLSCSLLTAQHLNCSVTDKWCLREAHLVPWASLIPGSVQHPTSSWKSKKEPVGFGNSYKSLKTCSRFCSAAQWVFVTCPFNRGAQRSPTSQLTYTGRQNPNPNCATIGKNTFVGLVCVMAEGTCKLQKGFLADRIIKWPELGGTLKII